MEEIWKDVVGYEGFYQVSNFGKVRSCDRVICYRNGNPYASHKKVNGSVIKQRISNTGYYRVKLCKVGEHKLCSVHRIVAEAFIPNPEQKEQVNHIDGNRLNNCVDNLEWATMSENVLHAYRTGLNHGLRGDLSPHKIAVLQYDKDGTFVRRWSCMADAARSVCGTKEGIYGVCKKRKYKKTYKGYIWRYAEA